MPFRKEMEDVFYYGIQQPVHTAGMLCERVDKSAFTGGIMDYVKNRIETAAVVIAELTGANPNVYLEVGYAWGKGRPTILITRDEKELHFDVQGQKCLTYETIKELEGFLHRELKEMISRGIVRL
jgi:nucleoside 2-deoxyribosyltransferase